MYFQEAFLLLSLAQLRGRALKSTKVKCVRQKQNLLNFRFIFQKTIYEKAFEKEHKIFEKHALNRITKNNPGVKKQFNRILDLFGLHEFFVKVKASIRVL